ncbi:MAG: sulfatase-like hydrolase/transferase, partial [Proteobacteria bacterium]|nr:sulfatase-like hydrolase/transferase [Pseudomonadota bacterium]
VGFVDQSFFHPKFGLVRGFERVGHQVGREKLVSAAESWLRATVAAGSTTPFLLYLHFLDAHRHHMKSEEEILSRWETVPERVGEAAIETAPGDLCAAPDANWCRAYQVYAHSIWELRASLVQILERLQSLALLDRTVVVVYSDHGEEFADHRAEQERRGTDSRGIHGVGHGQSLYQELLHVPLLAWHPDRPAQRIDAVVNLVDVAPTLAAWLGERDLGSEWDGQSLAEPERLDAARTVFASEVAFGPVETAAFRGNWKRVVRTEPEERLLFDLSADPREKDPVTRPEIEAELDGLIDDYRANARPPGPGVMELQKAELKALQALGYVGDVEAE